MKNILMSSLFMLFLVLAGCGQGTDVLKDAEENYTPPSILSQPRFYYPPAAQERSYAGSAKLYMVIDKEGKVARVSVIRSSGYEILDKASSDYCKTLLFTPAKKDGVPIDSRVVWEMKYNLASQNWCTGTYIKNVLRLLNEEKIVSKYEKKIVQDEILKLHNEFTRTMNDRLNYNIIVGQVISAGLSKEWQKDWDSWPLSFLLYYDFIKRFPDHDSLFKVREQLKNALKTDIQSIKNISADNIQAEVEKESILLKIRSFIKSEFPDTPLNEFGLNKLNEVKPIS